MKKIIISILFIILCLPTFGILEDKKVSLSNAIETVLSNNPQLKMSDIDIEIAKNTIKKENALKNPSVGTFQSIGKTAKGNAQEVGVDYVIEILKRGKRKNIAKIQSNIAQDDKNIQKINLVAEVKATYFTLLLKKTNLKLMDEQSKLSKETLDNIINDKSSLKTDIIQAKIAYNRSIMYRNIAKNEFISAQNDFNAIMNIKTVNYDTLEDSLTNDYSRFLTVDPENNSLTFEKIKEFALNNRYDIKKAKKGIDVANANLKLVKSKLIPDLTLEGGYAYKTKGISDYHAFESGAYAGARFNDVPIIYHYQPEIKNAKLEIEKAKLEYEDAEIDAIRNITDAWERYSITRENLIFYNNELLKNSKELLEESIKSLNDKKINLSSFLVSKKLYLELILGYEEALAEYYISFSELLKEMNINNLDEIETI